MLDSLSDTQKLDSKVVCYGVKMMLDINMHVDLAVTCLLRFVWFFYLV